MSNITSSIQKKITAPFCYDLSIVIISYNTLNMTKRCVESIIKNSYNLSIQIIVIDNNSHDGSAFMVKSQFPQVFLVENLENRGFAAANNQGFALCRGDFILLLNSDTIILDDVLEKSIDLLNSNPQVGAMGCQVLNPDRTVQYTCSGFPTLLRLLTMTLALDRIRALSFLDHYLMRTWARNDEREVEVISGCYLMIRKGLLDAVGFLDESFFFFGEETDLCRRIREAGWKLLFSPAGKIIHFGGGSIKKLNYKRDVMLTAATVRLHRKYGGITSAMLAYLILILFNFSRAAGWEVISFFNPSSKVRAQYFNKVVKAYRECWPD